jgi:predicted chitinase
MTTLQEIIENNLTLAFGDLNSSPITDDKELCEEIQVILQASGFYTRSVDGIYGEKTREGLRLFKTAYHLTGGDNLGSTTAQYLLSAKPNEGILPEWQGGDKDETVRAIIKEAHRQGISSNNQIAYIIATVQHETAGTFKPVEEAFYLRSGADKHRKKLKYFPFYGRGYVQLTWGYNYKAYKTLTNLDLLKDPDLALKPDVALFILIDGMKRGVFTGRNLDDYIFGRQIDFRNARRVINGLDKADEIQKIAEAWQSDLG